MKITPRFSISDLILVILAVAIALGWWRDHRQRADANEQLSNAAQKIDILYGINPTVRPAILRTLTDAYSDYRAVLLVDDPKSSSILVVATYGEQKGVDPKTKDFLAGSTLKVRGTVRWEDGRPVERCEVKASYCHAITGQAYG